MPEAVLGRWALNEYDFPVPIHQRVVSQLSIGLDPKCLQWQRLMRQTRYYVNIVPNHDVDAFRNLSSSSKNVSTSSAS